MKDRPQEMEDERPFKHPGGIVFSPSIMIGWNLL